MTFDHQPITSPWVLVDELTADQTAVLLERLVQWLDGPDAEAASRCARALSCGESDDPEAISGWADVLAARLRHCAESSELQTPPAAGHHQPHLNRNETATHTQKA